MTTAASALQGDGTPRASAWQNMVAAALALLGFSAPLSTAGVAVALVALVLLTLARAPALWRLAPWREPVMGAGLVLLAFIGAHTLWHSGFSETTLHTINRYHELLFAPLLMVLMRDARHRRVFLRALVAGAVVISIIHWISLLEPSLRAHLAPRRISAGFVLAVCAFIVLMRSRGAPNPWPQRALSAFLALTVLYAIDGRTGPVVLLALASWAAWLHSAARLRWVAALAAPLIVVVVAMSSSAVSDRVNETLNGAARSGARHELSSTGIRVQLLQLAADLAREHPLVGVGFGNYAQANWKAAEARYANNAAILQEHWVHATNPHNEYMMQLVGGGVLALLLFLAWLGLTFRASLRVPATAPSSGMLAGVALAFSIGCLFNSMLMDFVEGHLYMALIALLLAERRDPMSSQAGTGEVTKVLVIATRQIGDVLLTTPLIRQVRKRWPNARIEVLGFTGTLGMLRGNPDVDGLVETPFRAGWLGSWTLVARLWRRYDLALVTDQGDRAHLLGWVAASRRRGIVPARSGSNWWKRMLLDTVVVSAGDLGNVHAAAEKQSLLGAPADAAAEPVVGVIPPVAAPLPARVGSVLRHGAVIIHAPSMWPYKQWPLGHFEKLVNGLLADGLQVVLTGSAGERDQSCVAPLRALAAPPQLLDLSGQLDFAQLVGLFQDAALYIGPDTSITHLAAATGVPVIAIFGPTNPLRWAPWPRTDRPVVFVRASTAQQVGNVTIVQSTLPCVPCGRAGCEDHRQSRSDCLIDITPQQVLERARALLAAGR